MISARPPECVVNRDRRVKRLFPKYTFDEMAYAEKTGIFPIMHTLVLRRSVYEANPEIADGLINAFTEAKNRSIERSMSLTVPSYPFPWSGRMRSGQRDCWAPTSGRTGSRPTSEVWMCSWNTVLLSRSRHEG